MVNKNSESALQADGNPQPFWAVFSPKPARRFTDLHVPISPTASHKLQLPWPSEQRSVSNY